MFRAAIALHLIFYFSPEWLKLRYLSTLWFCLAAVGWLFAHPSVRDGCTRVFLKDSPIPISWVLEFVVHHILPPLRRYIHSVRTPADAGFARIPFRVVHAYWKRIRAYFFGLSIRRERYVYTPLQYAATTPERSEIRLIRLHPGSGDEPLRANIFHARLDEIIGRYETVSYAWEDSLQTCRLETYRGVVLITPSLFHALRRFRQSDKFRDLWADAVCINQADNAEKATQVAMMGDIYASAAGTLVYLGREADGSEEVRDLLQRITLASPILEQAYVSGGVAKPEFLCEFTPEQSMLFQLANLPARHDPAWKKLVKFWGRPWFRRVWVIQEFVLSPDVRVFCGDWEVNWSALYNFTLDAHQTLFLCVDLDFRNALENGAMNAGLETMHMMGRYRITALFDAMRRIGKPLQEGGGTYTLTMQKAKMVFKEQELFYSEWQKRAKTNSRLRLRVEGSLLELLTFSDRSEATRARDHLFAIHGLARDADGALFRPDYAAPFDQIVRRYGKGFVGKGQCMDLLYMARLNVQSLRFPSWIPDWTTKYIFMGSVIEYESLGTKSTGLYAAAGDTTCHPWVSEDPDDDRLILQGRIVDELGQVSGDHLRYDPIHDFIRRIRRAHDIITDLAAKHNSYPTGETFEDVYWRTLVANKTKDRLRAPKTFGEGLLKAAWNTPSFFNVLLAMTSPAAKETLLRFVGLSFYEAMYDCFKVYQLGVTKKGLFGLVPPLAEAGDQICILNGGAVPFVLRKRRSGGYRLVGECYIHGLMNGEAMQGAPVEEEICLH